MLCGGCGGGCLDGWDGVRIGCPACDETTEINGETCYACEGEGWFELDECPREYVGTELTEAINIATMCEGGTLPVSGGLLDQSAWFLSVWQELRNEEVRIENERAEKQSA